MHQQFHEIFMKHTNLLCIILQRSKKNFVKTNVLRYRTVPSEIILPKCDFLASNCQPTGLEGYLVKCIPIFTFACKKVGIDLLLSYSELG